MNDELTGEAALRRFVATSVIWYSEMPFRVYRSAFIVFLL